MRNLVEFLAENFTQSQSATHRKGGLAGIAAAATALRGNTAAYLDLFLPSVLTCFSDSDSSVRQMALSSLFNILQMADEAALPYLNVMFVGVCKLAADVDPDVKNTLDLVDNQLKSMVTHAAQSFDTAAFVPLLRDHANSTDMYVRRLFVSWVTTLDSVPEINMLEYLPDIMEGLFAMLSDANREVRTDAYDCLEDFLQQIAAVPLAEFEECVALQPIVSTLVRFSSAEARFPRVTAVEWLYQLIDLAGSIVRPVFAPVLDTVLARLGDTQQDIVEMAFKTSDLLMALVQRTDGDVGTESLLHIITETLPSTDQLQRSEALRWLQMLLQKAPEDVIRRVDSVLTALLHNLTDDSSVDVLKLNLDTLARLALHDRAYFFNTILHRLLQLLAGDRRLLEARGAFIIRRLCLLLDARDMYLSFSRLLVWEPRTEFVSVFIELLSLILLTAGEMAEFRTLLRGALGAGGEETGSDTLPTPPTGPPKDTLEGGGGASGTASSASTAAADAASASAKREEGGEGGVRYAADMSAFEVFSVLYGTWCHNPVATITLCLLSEAYEVAHGIVASLVERQITVGLLMQLDKLVQLIESPVFVTMRVHLVHPERPDHGHLLRCLYAVLMLLPQSAAFTVLRDRIQSVTSLHTVLSSGRGGVGGDASPHMMLPPQLQPAVATAPPAVLAKRKALLLQHYAAAQAWRLAAAETPDAPDGLTAPGEEAVSLPKATVPKETGVDGSS